MRLQKPLWGVIGSWETVRCMPHQRFVHGSSITVEDFKLKSKLGKADSCSTRGYWEQLGRQKQRSDLYLCRMWIIIANWIRVTGRNLPWLPQGFTWWSKHEQWVVFSFNILWLVSQISISCCDEIWGRGKNKGCPCWILALKPRA